MPTTLSSFGGAANEAAKTANYTIVSADNGTLFTNAAATAAIVFTLPLIASSLGFSVEFFVTANQVVSIASNEGTNIVVLNSAAKSSLIFSTGSQLIGSRIRISANAAGTLWYPEVKSVGVTALTVA